MKKLLIATTALVASTGFAAAQGVNVVGEAGFGVVYNGAGAGTLAPDFYAAVDFELRGETDMGLAFGADFGVNAAGWSGATNAATAASTDMAVVFVEGGFGRLSVGDVDNAEVAVVPGLGDVGYSGLGVDNVAENERGGNTANILYEGTFNDFTVGVSYDVLTFDYAVAGAYNFGDFTVGLGYSVDAAGPNDEVSLGVDATFGDFGVGALYIADTTNNTYSAGVEGSYTMGAVTVNGVFGYDSDAVTPEAYGLGVSYDLGGGATVDAGIAQVAGVTWADLGINMEF